MPDTPHSRLEMRFYWGCVAIGLGVVAAMVGYFDFYFISPARPSPLPWIIAALLTVIGIVMAATGVAALRRLDR